MVYEHCVIILLAHACRPRAWRDEFAVAGGGDEVDGASAEDGIGRNRQVTRSPQRIQAPAGGTIWRPGSFSVQGCFAEKAKRIYHKGTKSTKKTEENQEARRET